MRGVRNRLPVVVVAVWGLAVAGLALAAGHRGDPTAPEQVAIGEAVDRAETAVGEAITALEADGAVVIVERASVADCEVTVVRAGTEYTRTLTAYTEAGAERRILSDVAAVLGAHFAVQRYEIDDTAVVTAMDDGFVELRGESESAGSGLIRFTAATGCRPGSVAATTAAGRAPNALTGALT